MATCSQSINVRVTSSFTPTGLPGVIQPLATDQTYRVNLNSGVGADNIDLMYSTTLNLVASTPQAINLKSLLAPDGTAVAFVRIRSIVIVMKGTTDGMTLKLGYATTTANSWTALVSNPGTITLPASSASNMATLILTAPNTTGWTVGTSNRLLQFDPGADTFSVDVTFEGVSA